MQPVPACPLFVTPAVCSLKQIWNLFWSRTWQNTNHLVWEHFLKVADMKARQIKKSWQMCLKHEKWLSFLLNGFRSSAFPLICCTSCSLGLIHYLHLAGVSIFSEELGPGGNGVSTQIIGTSCLCCQGGETGSASAPQKAQGTQMKEMWVLRVCMLCTGCEHTCMASCMRFPACTYVCTEE